MGSAESIGRVLNMVYNLTFKWSKSRYTDDIADDIAVAHIVTNAKACTPQVLQSCWSFATSHQQWAARMLGLQLQSEQNNEQALLGNNSELNVTWSTIGAHMSNAAYYDSHRVRMHVLESAATASQLAHPPPYHACRTNPVPLRGRVEARLPCCIAQLTYMTKVHVSLLI